MQEIRRNWVTIVLTLIGFGVQNMSSSLAGASVFWILAAAVALWVNWQSVRQNLLHVFFVTAIILNVGAYMLAITGFVPPLLSVQQYYVISLGIGIGFLILVYFGLLILPNAYLKRLRTNQAELTELKKVLNPDLHSFYERQKLSWQSFIFLALHDVDCSSAQAGSPFVRLKFHTSNFLLVPLTITSVGECNGEIATQHHGRPNLPPLRLRLVNPIEVAPCSQKEFSIDLYIGNGRIAEALISSSLGNEVVTWLIKAQWKVNVYGQEVDGWTPSYELI